MIAPWNCWRNKSLLKRWFFAIQTIYLLVSGLPEFVSSTIPGSRRLCLMVGLLDFQGSQNVWTSNSHTLEVGTPPFQKKKVSTVNLLLDPWSTLATKNAKKLGGVFWPNENHFGEVGDLQLWRSMEVKVKVTAFKSPGTLDKNASIETRFNCTNHPKTKIISISWDEIRYMYLF